jgi:hypothetical protein
MPGGELLPAKLNDEFAGLIATRSQDNFAILIYNYIDPAAAMNYLSANIVHLNEADRKDVLNIVKSDRIDKIISGGTDLSALRLSANAKDIFSRAIEINGSAKKFASSNRKIKLSLKGQKRHSY